jgi:glycosyltransferase involved in cell wall biosynthesis
MANQFDDASAKRGRQEGRKNMTPRKLLFYTHALAGGGAERVFASLASSMAAHGHEVLFAVDFEAEENKPFLAPNIRFFVLGRDHLGAVTGLAHLLRSEKPDVSLSALCISNMKHVFAAILAGSLSRSILSYHGYWISEPQFLSRVSYTLTPILTRLAARTVCVSAGLKAYLKIHFGASPSRTVLIYNPVLTGPLTPARTAKELLSRQPIILASGRMVSYKNLPLLIRAFARMANRNAELLILGQGPEQSVIEAEIRRQHVEDRVKLLGYVAEPWPIYARARCFALSSDSEAFGLVVAEALANGLSVVSTNCDGPREILDRGRFGWLVPPGDEKQLSIALDAALNDPGEPAARIEQAKNFSIERAAAAYEALIEEVLAKKSPH